MHYALSEKASRSAEQQKWLEDYLQAILCDISYKQQTSVQARIASQRSQLID